MVTTALTRRRWLGMPFIALGVSMIIVDATIVNVAIPSIIRDLRVSTPTAEWFNAIYALVFAALLITVGRAGDIAAQASAAVVEASRAVAFSAALFVFIGLLATLGLPAVRPAEEGTFPNPVKVR